jgi:hypothetical protein
LFIKTSRRGQPRCSTLSCEAYGPVHSDHSESDFSGS